jgi:hypothetical protein
MSSIKFSHDEPLLRKQACYCIQRTGCTGLVTVKLSLGTAERHAKDGVQPHMRYQAQHYTDVSDQVHTLGPLHFGEEKNLLLLPGIKQ